MDNDCIVELEVMDDEVVEVDADEVMAMGGSINAVWGAIQGNIEQQTDLVEYIEENGGKIDSISVDGVVQSIDSKKNVDIDLSSYSKTEDLGELATKNTISYEEVTDKPTNLAITDKNNNFSSAQTFNGDVTINGNITQNGELYETHAEQVYTKNDKIIMRDGATGGLGENETTGLIAKMYDGQHDGELVFDKDGTARVGDVGDTQPLATRSESEDLTDGQIMTWDEINQKLIGTTGKIIRTLPVNSNNIFNFALNSECGYFIAKAGTKIATAIPGSTSYVTRYTFTYDTPVLITPAGPYTDGSLQHLHCFQDSNQNVVLKTFTNGSVVISDVNISNIMLRGSQETVTGVKTFSAQPLMTASLAEGDSSTKIPNTQWVKNEINNQTDRIIGMSENDFNNLTEYEDGVYYFTWED